MVGSRSAGVVFMGRDPGNDSSSVGPSPEKEIPRFVTARIQNFPARSNRKGVQEDAYLVVQIAGIADRPGDFLAEQMPQLAFESFSPATLQAAKSAGKPVVIDFSADW